MQRSKDGRPPGPVRWVVSGLALLAGAAALLPLLGIAPAATASVVVLGFGCSIGALVVWTTASGRRRR